MSIKYNSPIIIGGSGSCGSSLLTHLLNSHPDIFSGAELKIFTIPELYNNFKHFSADDKKLLIYDAEKLKKITPYYYSCSTPKKITTNLDKISLTFSDRLEKYYSITKKELFDIALKSNTFKKFIDKIFSLIIKNPLKTRWCEKTPANCYCIKKFLDLYPDGKYIHIIRDPYDNILSFEKRGFSIQMAVQRWLYDNSLFIPFMKDQNCKLVFYENLVQNTFAAMKSILEFLGYKEANIKLILENAQKSKVMAPNKPTWNASPNDKIVNTAINKKKKISKAKIDKIDFYLRNIYLNNSSLYSKNSEINVNYLMKLFNYDNPEALNNKTGLKISYLKYYLQMRKLKKYFRYTLLS